MLNEFLGLSEELPKIDEKVKEIAIAMTELMEYPQWEQFRAEIERYMTTFDKPCEHYAQNPDLAKHDYGAKFALKHILAFMERQKELTKQYAKLTYAIIFNTNILIS